MIVPTVERGLRFVVFWSIETAGAQPLDEVDVRLVHLPQKLARVRRQRFDIPALALGEQRIERNEDLPEPDRPVNTTMRLRGNSKSTFLRLCSRAP